MNMHACVDDVHKLNTEHINCQLHCVNDTNITLCSIPIDLFCALNELSGSQLQWVFLVHGDLFCKQRLNYSNWGKKKICLNCCWYQTGANGGSNGASSFVFANNKRINGKTIRSTWLSSAVNFEGHNAGALLCKRVMDSLAGPGGPSRGAQYATGIRVSVSVLPPPKKNLPDKFLNAAEVLMVFL